MLPNFFYSCAAHLTGPVLRIFSTVLIFFSFSLFLPLFLGLWYQEGGTWEFLYSFLIIFFIGILFWFPSRNATKPLQLHQTFILVALVWLCLCFAGALPFLLSDIPGLGIVNSFFESFSGLTTTGASVVVNLEYFSKSLLFYRQLLQWIGGLGVIVIAIGIAPTLGIGAIQLYRVGILHNANDTDRFRPRISGIARSLWVVYLVLTLACALSYWLAGLDVFDAICMSMSTISIGGFVPYSANMDHFVGNSKVLLVAMLFMIIAAMNFGLHFLAFSRRTLSHYFKNTEIIIFLGITTTVVLITVSYLFATGHAADDLFLGAFHAISIGTTSGFTTSVYYTWPAFVTSLLLLASFIGCCTGSTGGGLKVFRFWLLMRQGMKELAQISNPRAVFSLKIGHRFVSEKNALSIWGFFSAYIISLTVIALLLLLTGLDHVTAFTSAAATLNNLGPGLGDVISTYAGISDVGKIILCFSMVLGRLEILVLLVLLSPSFWCR